MPMSWKLNRGLSFTVIVLGIAFMNEDSATEGNVGVWIGCVHGDEELDAEDSGVGF